MASKEVVLAWMWENYYVDLSEAQTAEVMGCWRRLSGSRILTTPTA